MSSSIPEQFSLRRASVIIALLTIVAKVVALFRDPLLASYVGVGTNLDIYTASFRIPDTLFNLLILGTLSVAFIPVFSQYLLEDKERAWRIARTVATASFLIMFFAMLLAAFFTAPLVRLLVPGFSGLQFDQVVHMTRLMLVSPLLFTLASTYAGILQSFKRFVLTSIAPAVYNLGIMFGVVFLYPRFGLYGLAYGVIVGALLYLLLFVPSLFRLGFSFKPLMDLQDTAVRKVVALYLPRILGLDIGQVMLLVGTFFGSLLPSGSIGILALAYNLQTVPLGVVGVATGTAAFPVLSEAYARKDLSGFLDILQRGILQTLFIVLPMSFLSYILAMPLIRIFFVHGKFTEQDGVITAILFAVLSLSIFSQCLMPLLVRAFYARQNTVIPVVINLSSIVLIVVLSYFGFETYGVQVVAFAFSFTSIVGALITYVILRAYLSREDANKELPVFEKRLSRQVLKMFVAAVIVGVLAYGLRSFFETTLHLDGSFLNQASMFVAVTLTAVVVYFFLARLLKIGEAEGYMSMVRRLFARVS